MYLYTYISIYIEFLKKWEECSKLPGLLVITNYSFINALYDLTLWVKHYILRIYVLAINCCLTSYPRTYVLKTKTFTISQLRGRNSKAAYLGSAGPGFS